MVEHSIDPLIMNLSQQFHSFPFRKGRITEVNFILRKAHLRRAQAGLRLGMGNRLDRSDPSTHVDRSEILTRP